MKATNGALGRGGGVHISRTHSFAGVGVGEAGGGSLPLLEEPARHSWREKQPRSLDQRQRSDRGARALGCN